ncbi:hypothetical protein C8Q74DRAFT_767653 [Fomes fomentarius]|nr:hypothetical protein C8Q74DRAFT_767653 [Fomes fomentarius]
MDIGVEGWNDVPAAPAAAIMDEATRAWQAQERMLQELMGPISTGGPCSIDFGFDTELLTSESPATIPSRPSSAGSAATSSSSGVSSSSGASSSSRGKKRRRSTAERDSPSSSSSSRSPSAFSGDAPSEASSPEDSSSLPRKKHKLSDAPREFTIDTRPLWRQVDPEDPRDIREEPVRDRPIVRDRRVLAQGHVYVSRVHWDSQPPTWNGEVIPKMPIDDVWPYLLAKYRVGKMTQCHMDGCTKDHGKKKGWLKNHILGASHLHVRTLCEKCGYRCRSDNFDERHAKQECEAALPWERQVRPKARRRRAD